MTESLGREALDFRASARFGCNARQSISHHLAPNECVCLGRTEKQCSTGAGTTLELSSKMRSNSALACGCSRATHGESLWWCLEFVSNFSVLVVEVHGLRKSGSIAGRV